MEEEGDRDRDRDREGNRELILSPRELAGRRRQARERTLQRHKEEEAAVEESLRAEREEQERVKARMQAKAVALQEATARRVAEYKVIPIPPSSPLRSCALL